MAEEKDPAFVDVRENDAREAARSIQILGSGVTLKNWAESVDYAKYMARATHAISKHLRGDVNLCLAVLDLATRWDFSPFMVAGSCHVINDKLCFESKLIHAVVEKFAPIKYRLRRRYEGNIADGTLKCIVTGHFKGELDPVEYESPELRNIHPKNSPLWKTDPPQQLWYLSSKRWADAYCPDILFGIHTKAEMEDSDPHIGFDNAKDVTPKLAERLSVAVDESFVDEKTFAGIEEALQAARTEG